MRLIHFVSSSNSSGNMLLMACVYRLNRDWHKTWEDSRYCDWNVWKNDRSAFVNCCTLFADGLNGLPEPQSMRVENKMFYFDVGQNRRGVFMRVSEVYYF